MVRKQKQKPSFSRVGFNPEGELSESDFTPGSAGDPAPVWEHLCAYGQGRSPPAQGLCRGRARPGMLRREGGREARDAAGASPSGGGTSLDPLQKTLPRVALINSCA